MNLKILLLLSIAFTLTVSGLRVSKQKYYTLVDDRADSQLTFENPRLALQILDILDPTPVLMEMSNHSIGVINEDDYCMKVHEEMAQNPQFIFSNSYFLTDYDNSTFVANEMIPLFGSAVSPAIDVSPGDNKTNLPLSPLITNTFTQTSLEFNLQLNVNFGCITQNVNHIPGTYMLTRKDAIAIAGEEYYEKYSAKPHCFDRNKFFPKTWLLDDDESCREWFDYLNSDKYSKEKEEKRIVFIAKIASGSHRGNGVEVVNEELELNIRNFYKNGQNCGQQEKNLIVQRYINNPLLVQNHKFDFRVYLMIASTNPLIVYYHDGFLRVSLFEYDVNSNEKGMHLTNTAQSDKVFQDKSLQDQLKMNETELRNFQMWNYTRLAQYLVSIGKIDSVKWVDDYLRPSFEHAMQHLIRMTKDSFSKNSNVWEFFGVDFMLDEDLNLWFIECNAGPVIQASSEEKGAMLKSMLKDMMEIINAQLRSRIKRLITFINLLTQEGFVRENIFSQIKTSDLNRNMQTYNKLMQNKIEKEFAISKENSWVKIIDETIDGPERYNGMFAPDCYE